MDIATFQANLQEPTVPEPPFVVVDPQYRLNLVSWRGVAFVAVSTSKISQSQSADVLRSYKVTLKSYFGKLQTFKNRHFFGFHNVAAKPPRRRSSSPRRRCARGSSAWATAPWRRPSARPRRSSNDPPAAERSHLGTNAMRNSRRKLIFGHDSKFEDFDFHDMKDCPMNNEQLLFGMVL